MYWVFSGSSAGKESACNAGDPSSISGLGKSAGEGRGYPLQYSWASLVAQLVKNPSAMWETQVWSLGWEDPLEKGVVIPVFLPGEFLWTEESGGLQSMGSQRVRHDWATKNSTAHLFFSWNTTFAISRWLYRWAFYYVPLIYLFLCQHNSSF